MSTVRKIKLITKDYKKENFYCNLCKYPLVTNKDFDSDLEFGCCDDCFTQFAESRKEEWKNGWRPSKTVLRDYILLKNKLNSKEIK
jgi:hypothetical protein